MHRFEPLESRRMLAGAISGSVEFDPNADSKPEDAVLAQLQHINIHVANRRVWLDENGNNRLDDVEQITRTNAIGNYHFYNVPAGVHDVRVLLGPGEIQSLPSKNRVLQVHVVDGA